MNHTRKLKRTHLYNQHLQLGARMAPFGGYEMPIQYHGIVEEHTAARERAALFDTCHMGEFTIQGESAEADLENILSCHIADLAVQRCRYSFMCNPEGGVIDDLLVYRFSHDRFMLVVNASTCESDKEWIQRHLSQNTELIDQSPDTAKLDLQGPQAPAIARELMESPIDELVFFSFQENQFNGRPLLLSRTGYTGEIGFEFYCVPEIVEELWQACLDKGATPAGLGARDTLRLEMGMPLYGHELSENRNAGESGFTRVLPDDKEFIGSSAVHDASRHRQKLAGLIISGRRAARAEDSILDAETGDPVGTITSGCFSPTLGVPIALAYLNEETAEPGRQVHVAGKKHNLKAEVAETPFHKYGTARNKMSRFL